MTLEYATSPVYCRPVWRLMKLVVRKPKNSQLDPLPIIYTNLKEGSDNKKILGSRRISYRRVDGQLLSAINKVFVV